MRSFVVFAGMIVAASSFSLAGDVPQKVKPVVVLTGIDSKQPKDLYVRCRSAKEWEAVWNGHCGGERPHELPACPEVDFDSYMVIGVIQYTSRIRVYEIAEEKDRVRLRYQPWGNQTVFVPDGDKGAVKIVELGRGDIDSTKPYLRSFAFIVLPMSNKAVVLEEDVRTIISNPPMWKERATLPAIVEK